jgi:hypothetical protein
MIMHQLRSYLLLLDMVGLSAEVLFKDIFQHSSLLT